MVPSVQDHQQLSLSGAARQEGPLDLEGQDAVAAPQGRPGGGQASSVPTEGRHAVNTGISNYGNEDTNLPGAMKDQKTSHDCLLGLGFNVRSPGSRHGFVTKDELQQSAKDLVRDVQASAQAVVWVVVVISCHGRLPENGSDIPELMTSDGQFFNVEAELVAPLNRLHLPGTTLNALFIFDCCRVSGRCLTWRSAPEQRARCVLPLLENNFFFVFSCDRGRATHEGSRGGFIIPEVMALLPYAVPLTRVLEQAVQNALMGGATTLQRPWIHSRLGATIPVLGGREGQLPTMVLDWNPLESSLQTLVLCSLGEAETLPVAQALSGSREPFGESGVCDFAWGQRFRIIDAGDVRDLVVSLREMADLAPMGVDAFLCVLPHGHTEEMRRSCAADEDLARHMLMIHPEAVPEGAVASVSWEGPDKDRRLFEGVARLRGRNGYSRYMNEKLREARQWRAVLEKVTGRLSNGEEVLSARQAAIERRRKYSSLDAIGDVLEMLEKERRRMEKAALMQEGRGVVVGGAPAGGGAQWQPPVTRQDSQNVAGTRGLVTLEVYAAVVGVTMVVPCFIPLGFTEPGCDRLRKERAERSSEVVQLFGYFVVDHVTHCLRHLVSGALLLRMCYAWQPKKVRSRDGDAKQILRGITRYYIASFVRHVGHTVATMVRDCVPLRTDVQIDVIMELCEVWVTAGSALCGFALHYLIYLRLRSAGLSGPILGTLETLLCLQPLLICLTVLVYFFLRLSGLMGTYAEILPTIGILSILFFFVSTIFNGIGAWQFGKLWWEHSHAAIIHAGSVSKEERWTYRLGWNLAATIVSWSSTAVLLILYAFGPLIASGREDEEKWADLQGKAYTIDSLLNDFCVCVMSDFWNPARLAEDLRSSEAGATEHRSRQQLSDKCRKRNEAAWETLPDHVEKKIAELLQEIEKGTGDLQRPFAELAAVIAPQRGRIVEDKKSCFEWYKSYPPRYGKLMAVQGTREQRDLADEALPEPARELLASKVQEFNAASKPHELGLEPAEWGFLDIHIDGSSAELREDYGLTVVVFHEPYAPAAFSAFVAGCTLSRKCCFDPSDSDGLGLAPMVHVVLELSEPAPVAFQVALVLKDTYNLWCLQQHLQRKFLKAQGLMERRRLEAAQRGVVRAQPRTTHL